MFCDQGSTCVLCVWDLICPLSFKLQRLQTLLRRSNQQCEYLSGISQWWHRALEEELRVCCSQMPSHCLWRTSRVPPFLGRGQACHPNHFHPFIPVMLPQWMHAQSGYHPGGPNLLTPPQYGNVGDGLISKISSFMCPFHHLSNPSQNSSTLGSINYV